MSNWNGNLAALGRSRVKPARLAARYDAAQTTDENRRHWAAADGFAPDEANNLGVRTILRNRSRYVMANNPRARGMISTLANHTVGTGPKLQMLMGTGTVASRMNTRIEEAFGAWAREVKFGKKLRVMRKAKAHTGEVLAVLVVNPGLRSPVKLDVQVIEADQLTSPWGQPLAVGEVDGIRFDAFGNRTTYSVLTCHPGDAFRGLNPGEFRELPARAVTHYYVDEDRPGVHRGVPEIASSVQVFEEARRFRAAVLGAAETAADYAMAIQTDVPGEESDDLIPMDTFELERRMATTLPKGWKLTQTKAEQPTTTFREFTRELLSEVARCLNMPLTIAALDSSTSNMSSAYLDYQPYAAAIAVERDDLTAFVDNVLDAWLTLALSPAAGVFDRRAVPKAFPHTWFWPYVGEHADPQKVAVGQDLRLKNNLTTLSDEYAKRGQDWETQLRQRARERRLQAELGLPDPAAMPGLAPAAADADAAPPADPEDDDEV